MLTIDDVSNELTPLFVATKLCGYRACEIHTKTNATKSEYACVFWINQTSYIVTASYANKNRNVSCVALETLGDKGINVEWNSPAKHLDINDIYPLKSIIEDLLRE